MSSDYVRLTPDRQSRRGGLWNTKPWGGVPDGNAWFEAIIEFRVRRGLWEASQPPPSFSPWVLYMTL